MLESQAERDETRLDKLSSQKIKFKVVFNTVCVQFTTENGAHIK